MILKTRCIIPIITRLTYGGYTPFIILLLWETIASYLCAIKRCERIFGRRNQRVFTALKFTPGVRQEPIGTPVTFAGLYFKTVLQQAMYGTHNL